MTRVILNDPLIAGRSAFGVLFDQRIELVGETSDWFNLHNKAGFVCPDMILLSREFMLKKYHQAIEVLGKDCPKAHIV